MYKLTTRKKKYIYMYILLKLSSKF